LKGGLQVSSNGIASTPQGADGTEALQRVVEGSSPFPSQLPSRAQLRFSRESNQLQLRLGDRMASGTFYIWHPADDGDHGMGLNDSPASIDLVLTQGSIVGTMHGLLYSNSHGKLVLVLGDPGAPRPRPTASGFDERVLLLMLTKSNALLTSRWPWPKPNSIPSFRQPVPPPAGPQPVAPSQPPRGSLTPSDQLGEGQGTQSPSRASQLGSSSGQDLAAPQQPMEAERVQSPVEAQQDEANKPSETDNQLVLRTCSCCMQQGDGYKECCDKIDRNLVEAFALCRRFVSAFGPSSSSSSSSSSSKGRQSFGGSAIAEEAQRMPGGQLDVGRSRQEEAGERGGRHRNGTDNVISSVYEILRNQSTAIIGATVVICSAMILFVKRWFASKKIANRKYGHYRMVGLAGSAPPSDEI